MKTIREFLVYRRFLLIIFTPLLLLPLPLIIRTKEAECAYTLFVVAIFWLTEALPLAVSALIPALMFPLFGILASKKVASAYFRDFHLLLTGIICLATSIEKWNLHKRIALRMVMLVGVNPAWSIATSFLDISLSISIRALEGNSTGAALVSAGFFFSSVQLLQKDCEALPVYMPDLLLCLAAKEIH